MAHSGGVLISIFQGFSGSIGKFFALAGGGGGEGEGGGWALEYHFMKFRQFSDFS